MTGHDSSHDTSPQNIAMLSLAAFSTCYNLPVYIRYNNTFRRDYVRMLRCQYGQVCDSAQSVVGTRSRGATVTGIRRHGETDGAKTQQRDSSRRVTFGREPQDRNEPKPSTSYDRRVTIDPAPYIVRSHQLNTQQLDSRLATERY